MFCVEGVGGTGPLKIPRPGLGMTKRRLLASIGRGDLLGAADGTSEVVL